MEDILNNNHFAFIERVIKSIQFINNPEIILYESSKEQNLHYYMYLIINNHQIMMDKKLCLQQNKLYHLSPYDCSYKQYVDEKTGEKIIMKSKEKYTVHSDMNNTLFTDQC